MYHQDLPTKWMENNRDTTKKYLLKFLTSVLNPTF